MIHTNITQEDTNGRTPKGKQLTQVIQILIDLARQIDWKALFRKTKAPKSINPQLWAAEFAAEVRSSKSYAVAWHGENRILVTLGGGKTMEFFRYTGTLLPSQEAFAGIIEANQWSGVCFVPTQEGHNTRLSVPSGNWLFWLMICPDTFDPPPSWGQPGECQA